MASASNIIANTFEHDSEIRSALTTSPRCFILQKVETTAINLTGSAKPPQVFITELGPLEARLGPLNISDLVEVGWEGVMEEEEEEAEEEEEEAEEEEEEAGGSSRGRAPGAEAGADFLRLRTNIYIYIYNFK